MRDLVVSGKLKGVLKAQAFKIVKAEFEKITLITGHTSKGKPVASTMMKYYMITRDRKIGMDAVRNEIIKAWEVANKERKPSRPTNI